MSYTRGDEFDTDRVSTCCGAVMYADSDRCSDCKEMSDSWDADDDERPLSDKEFSETVRSMETLYRGEVNAGIHVPKTY